MKVKEAIARLQQEDPEAELHMCADEHGGSISATTEVEEMWATTTRYGIFTPNPTTVNIVYLDTGTCGL